MYRRNVAGQHVGFVLLSFVDGQVLLGIAADVKVWLSKDGTTQFQGVGPVTELGHGQYDYAPVASELDADEVSVLFTAPDAVALEKTLLTTACDPQDALTFGIGALPAHVPAAAGGLPILGDNAGPFNVDSILLTGSLDVQGGVVLSNIAGLGLEVQDGATIESDTGDALLLLAGGTGDGLHCIGGGAGGSGIHARSSGNAGAGLFLESGGGDAAMLVEASGRDAGGSATTGIAVLSLEGEGAVIGGATNGLHCIGSGSGFAGLLAENSTGQAAVAVTGTWP